MRTSETGIFLKHCLVLLLKPRTLAAVLISIIAFVPRQETISAETPQSPAIPVRIQSCVESRQLKIKGEQCAVRVSCTSKVEPSTRKWTQGAFSSAKRTSTAMQSVGPTAQHALKKGTLQGPLTLNGIKLGDLYGQVVKMLGKPLRQKNPFS